MNIVLLVFQFMLILTQLNQLFTVNFCYLCDARKDQTCTRDLKKESIMNCTGTKTTDACTAIIYNDGMVTRGCDRACEHETSGSDYTILCCYTDFCNDDVFTSTSTPTPTSKFTTKLTHQPTSISNKISKHTSESNLTSMSNFQLIFIFVLISIKFTE